MLRRHAFALFAFAALVAAPLAAQQAGGPTDAPIKLPLDGLDIGFDDSGAWTTISSTYRQPVSYPDRAGIRKAYTMAEEKAKAAIIRYFEENVSSERIISEVNTESQTARREQNGKEESVSRETQRKMVESVTEFTRSYSKGTLRGLTILEQGFDEKNEEVWVTIGLSRRSVANARTLQQDLEAPTNGSSGTSSRTTEGRPLYQPGEVRRRAPQR